MIETIHLMLVKSPLLRIFLIIGLGFILGHIKIAGFQLNVAAVLFVGIIFGAWDAQRFHIPEEISMLGLILAIYIIGLQSGPVFFTIFRERGARFNLLAASSLVFALVVSCSLGLLLNVPAGLQAGVFAGSLTNTPALAAAIDTMRIVANDNKISLSDVIKQIGDPTVAYGISYPFGVLGVIIAIQIFVRLNRSTFELEKEKYRKGMEEKQNLDFNEFEIRNQQLDGKKFGEIDLYEMTGVVFTRMSHKGFISLLSPESVLHVGDILAGVGTPENMEKAKLVVGPQVPSSSLSFSKQIEYRDIVVTNRDLAGKRVWDFNIDKGFGAIISRVKRGFTNLPIDHHTTLEYGDQIRVVAYHDHIDEVCQRFGNPLMDLSENDLLSLALGVIMGILVGMIPIPIPGGTVFQFGFAGGSLVVALVLGWLGRTGPIIWTLPFNASLAIRQLGLYLFMVGVGVKAGGNFLQILGREGLIIFGVGAITTFSVAFLTLVVGHRIFKIDIIQLLGITSGIHTQPACLDYARELAGSEAPNVYYTTVQPISMLLKILFAQGIIFFTW